MNSKNSLIQAPSSVVMCRPHHFISNPQTAGDNSFQIIDNDVKGDNVKGNDLRKNEISALAFEEVSNVAKKLSQRGVTVHLFEDESTETPDSVFPNNWFSTHSNGMIGIYPMYSENRRKERRSDILAFLKSHYHVQGISDYSEYENLEMYLEGTGALVLDHMNRFAYGSVSNRLDPKLFQMFCDDFDYSPVLFNATNDKNIPVYHTNVLMNVAKNFSMICLSMIKCINEKSHVQKTLLDSGKEIIELTENQIHQFSGNTLELSNGKESFLAMSETAFSALSDHQINSILEYIPIETFSIPTIEQAGGSIRCMLAGIHLSPR